MSMGNGRNRYRARVVASMKQVLELPNGEAVYLKLYKEVRSSIRYAVGSGGDLLVRLPANFVTAEVERHVTRAKEWYFQQLQENESLQKRVGVVNYEDGQELVVLGQRVLLSIEEKRTNSCKGRLEPKVENGKLYLHFLICSGLSDMERSRLIGDMLGRFLSKYCLKALERRVAYLRDQYFSGAVYGRVSIRNTRRQWGSCSVLGNLSFSVRLLFAPTEVLDYVIIHELAHLRERNHSASFWALVERAMPDYRDREAWLRRYGSDLRL